jgi:hypothetical protein
LLSAVRMLSVTGCKGVLSGIAMRHDDDDDDDGDGDDDG